MQSNLIEEGVLESEENSFDEGQISEDVLEQVRRRCADTRVDVEVRTDTDGDHYVSVLFPNGREKRQITFWDSAKLSKLLEISFEKYVFLGNYIAIANYEDNSIEAVITTLTPSMRGPFFRKLLNWTGETDEPSTIRLSHTINGQDINLEIGECSEELRLLARGLPMRTRSLSLKIMGLKLTQHNTALHALMKISGSLFFQIDLQTGTTFNLARMRRRRHALGVRSGVRNREDIPTFEFPKLELDSDPLSLYWYARSALGMPLLQFLAYYQVIEYYYPTYAQEEARRRVRTILKDPTFRKDRDADIGKIISTLSGTGRGVGGELAQLRATIYACISNEELQSFLIEEDGRKAFFSAKQPGLTEKKIPLSSKDADLRTAAADLIYDIRCRIVHTKGERHDGEVELLLPFSKEAELLDHDIELMMFVARKVLIAAGSTLSL